MNPGISLESAPSGLNYSPGCFWPVINDLVTPPTPFFKHKPKYDTAQRLKKKDFFFCPAMSKCCGNSPGAVSTAIKL